MRHIALSQKENENNLRWASLPVLCCQAAGGEPEKALPVAAAWYLFYLAAGIMDSVEDGDPPAAWWEEAGPGFALSIATGLYFSANLALNRLEEAGSSPSVARQVRRGVLDRFFEMGAGQHDDIHQPAPDLAQYWQVARKKSGAFFETATWAGARLAVRQKNKIQGYSQFGMSVGLIIQILDDLHDYLQLQQREVGASDVDLKRSLPSVYIHEVAPAPVVASFDRLVDSKMSPAQVEAIFKMVDLYGGSDYIKNKLDGLYQSAVASLDQAEARGPARGEMIELLNTLHSP